MNVNEYKLKQRVRLIDIDRTGLIEAILTDSDGVSYRVRYWDQCERKVVWVWPDEIGMEKVTP